VKPAAGYRPLAYSSPEAVQTTGTVAIIVLLATGAFAAPFGTIADPDILFFVSALMLIVCFFLYHEPMDLAYAGYLALLGQLVEHVGEATGQWHYPDSLGAACRCGYCRCGPESDCSRGGWSCLSCPN
jgi:hypothetical protein